MPTLLPSYYTNKSQLNPAMLEITPSKQCEGWPYLDGIGPMTGKCTEYLSHPMGRYQFAMYNCPSGLYNGRPLNIEVEEVSNANWTNNWCQTLGNGKPKPL